MRQFRADLRGELALGEGFLDRLVTRVGYTDYTHTEFEGGEVGTVFDVKGKDWSDLAPGRCALTDFIVPRDLD